METEVGAPAVLAGHVAIAIGRAAQRLQRLPERVVAADAVNLERNVVCPAWAFVVAPDWWAEAKSGEE